jgi:hypothetical protein
MVRQSRLHDGRELRYGQLLSCPVFDEDALLYVDPNLCWAEPDIMDAVAWLRRLASDPKLRRSIGNGARKDVDGALSTGCRQARVRELPARNYSLGPTKPAWL